MQAEAGKGSKPRHQQDHDAYSDGYDRIFKKSKEVDVFDMISRVYDSYEGRKGYANVATFARSVCKRIIGVGTAGEREVYMYRNDMVELSTIDGYLLAVVDVDEPEDDYEGSAWVVIGAYPILKTEGVLITIDQGRGHFIKFTGYSSSYEGVVFDSGPVKVYPKQVAVTVFE